MIGDSGEAIAALIRDLLDKMATEPADDAAPNRPASASLSPGWHNVLPQGSDRPVVAAWQPWAVLRPVDVVQAKGLILVVFEERDEVDRSVYLYVESLAGYADLQMDNRQIAGLITMHLEELLGGVGWQQHVPVLRLGRLVILKPSNLTGTD